MIGPTVGIPFAIKCVGDAGGEWRLGADECDVDAREAVVVAGLVYVDEFDAFAY